LLYRSGRLINNILKFQRRERRPPFEALVFIFMEVWKTIQGFENYEVSNLGNIRRLYLKGYKYRKPIIQYGYCTITFSVGLKFKKLQVHRLVAIEFLENKEKKPCVNHINGIKTDNRVDNLEWCTYSENEKHSFDKLGKITNGIIRRKISINDIKYIKNLYLKGLYQKDIAKIYNVNQSTISLIINEKTYIKHV